MSTARALERHGAAFAPLACGAVLVALAATVLGVQYPPLLDYPNHFARLWLLAGGAERAPLSAMYAIDWSGASTNIGIDLLGATVGRLVGAAALGPALAVAALTLPVLGAMALNRSMFGGWHWWQVGFGVLAWNSTFLAGFLSFQIGLGLALLAAAADPAIARRAGPFGAAVIRVVLAAALLICHAFALAFYGALLAGVAFGPAMPFGAGGRPGRALRRGALTAGIALGLPLAVFLLAAPKVPGGHAPPGLADPLAGYTLLNKALTVGSAFVTYDVRVDALALLVLWLILRVASPRKPRIHAGLLLAAGTLLVLAIVVPSTLAGTAFIDWRFPVMALFTAAAAIRPAPARSSRAALALMALSLARTVWIGGIWEQRQSDFAAVERALAAVPAGAAVLPAEASPDPAAKPPPGRTLIGGLPAFWHAAALAVPLRQAFIPTLFAARGKQPLVVLPPWKEIAVPEGVPAPMAALDTLMPTPLATYAYGYVAHWRTRFDYVLLVNADLATVAPVPPGLALVEDAGFARLYRLLRP